MRFFLVVLLSVSAAVCSCTPSGYVIKGDIRGIDGRDMNLLDQSGHIIATSEVKDGRFTFSGKIDKPQLTYVNNGIGVRYPIDIPVLLENRRIKVTGDASKRHIVISGTRANENMVKYKERRDALAPDDTEAYLALVREIFDANCDNILGAMLISNMYSLVSDRELLECCDRLPRELAEDETILSYKEISQARIDTEPGCRFVDLESTAPDGELRRLSDVVESSSLTMLLFWASWNYSNADIIPGLMEMCRRYEGRGLSLFTVSPDTDKGKWKKTAEQFDVHGVNVYGDIEEARRLMKPYGIDGMPKAIIIDNSGKIVAKGQRVEDMEPMIANILGE